MIYLVEDSEVLREQLSAMLKEFVGQEVLGFSSTEAQATAWLNSHPDQWRVAVLDLFLQQGSGLGVLSSCQARRPGQKVVVLTNYATPDIRRRALALGADAVFDKQTELTQFLNYCAEPDAAHEAAPA
jgi:DNA-binding NarL/FixJ family response regulator